MLPARPAERAAGRRPGRRPPRPRARDENARRPALRAGPRPRRCARRRGPRERRAVRRTRVADRIRAPVLRHAATRSAAHAGRSARLPGLPGARQGVPGPAVGGWRGERGGGRLRDPADGGPAGGGELRRCRDMETSSGRTPAPRSRRVVRRVRPPRRPRLARVPRRREQLALIAAPAGAGGGGRSRLDGRRHVHGVSAIRHRPGRVAIAQPRRPGAAGRPSQAHRRGPGLREAPPSRDARCGLDRPAADDRSGDRGIARAQGQPEPRVSGRAGRAADVPPGLRLPRRVRRGWAAGRPELRQLPERPVGRPARAEPAGLARRRQLRRAGGAGAWRTGAALVHRAAGGRLLCGAGAERTFPGAGALFGA